MHLLCFESPCFGTEHVDTCFSSLLLSLPSHHSCYDDQHVSFYFSGWFCVEGKWGYSIFILKSNVLHSRKPPFFVPANLLQESLFCAWIFSFQVILQLYSLLYGIPKALVVSLPPIWGCTGKGWRGTLSVSYCIWKNLHFWIPATCHSITEAEICGVLCHIRGVKCPNQIL